MNGKRILISAAIVSISGFVSAATFHTPIAPSWARPTSSAQAATSLTTYEEWDGFAVTDVTNEPTGSSYFTSGMTVPTAGDSSSATSGAFIIANGTANNNYYTNTSVGDIYSFSSTSNITPQIIVPGYNVAGNQLNVQVEVQWYGAPINANDLTVNGTPATSLANYTHTQVYNDGGSDVGFGFAYVADELWSFSLPDTASLQLNFGWDAADSGLEVASVDTQSVAVPEPASLGLLVIAAAMLPRRRCRR